MSAALVLACLILAADDDATVSVKAPLPRGHAHNDYHHKHPLQDALDHGFCSVEADIFLVGDQLLVGHSIFELRKDRTLETLYLEPLRKRVAAHEGRVYRNGPMFTLLIDIKTNGKQVYPVLARTLAKYNQMLTSIHQGEVRKRAVQVVISGDRPRALIAADKTRFVGIDGRLGDLDSDEPSHLVPLISDRWSSQFTWRGDGRFPEAERKKLRKIVETAHAKGRRVRFWATPEKPAIWRELLDARVDHINTDHLKQLSEFLRDHDRPTQP